MVSIRFLYTLLRWIGFVEESLFTFASDPYADHHLLGIHRHPDGLWQDFALSQDLLAFCDRLAKMAAPPAPGSAAAASPGPSADSDPALAQMEAAILRPMLRLTLHTL